MKIQNISKKTVIIMAIVIVVFLSGCGSQTYSNQRYHVGTQGLVVEFQKTTKDVVYENEEFGNIMYIQNKGAQDINSNNPAILKINYDDYRLTLKDGINTKTIGSLGGKNPATPVGMEQPVENYFTANLLTKLRESATTKISYNLCYPYTTELTTVTCIDTKLATRSDGAVACTSQPYSGSSGQGAPVVITQIVPEIQLQSNYVKPTFNIYISNLGNGYVTSASSCSNADLTNSQVIGIVNVDAWLSGQKLECGPSDTGQMRLVDGQSFIKCYLPQYSQGYSRDQKNYLTTLTVNVSYTYTDIIQREVQIKRDVSITQRPDDDFIGGSSCKNYEAFDGAQGKCVSKCDYCAKNPLDYQCNYNPFQQGGGSFSFNNGFGCACNSVQCDDKVNKGSCVKASGYCPANIYCCVFNVCKADEVEIEGKCVKKDLALSQNIDMCAYCSGIDGKNGICQFESLGVSAYITNGFSCTCGPDDGKNTQTYNFIPDQRYCNNGLYCCKKT